MTSRRPQLSTTITDIHVYIDDHPGCTGPEIIAALEIPSGTFYRSMQKLQRAGSVKKRQEPRPTFSCFPNGNQNKPLQWCYYDADWEP